LCGPKLASGTQPNEFSLPSPDGKGVVSESKIGQPLVFDGSRFAQRQTSRLIATRAGG
jgi:hypothetical protein